MKIYPDQERLNWRDITEADATDAELHLVYRIAGGRPNYITREQWRENMKACAKDIRAHVEHVSNSVIRPHGFLPALS